jgi:hypothetical protein
LTNSATVSGGGDPNSHTATDPTHSGDPVQIASMGTPNLMVTAGGQTSTQFDVESSSGEGTLNFSCSGLPAGSTCAFNPPNGNSLSQVVNMTVTTALGNASHVPPAFRRSLRFYAALLPFPAIILLAVGRKKKHRRWRLMAGATLLPALLALTDCGGGTFVRQGGTPAGTFTVTVKATSATTGDSGSTTVNLTVISPGLQGH